MFWGYFMIFIDIFITNLCMKMMWPQLYFFFMLIFIILSFQIKKNQISEFLPTWIFLASKCHPHYRRSASDWSPSLLYRWRKGDLLQVFKIITNEVNINISHTGCHKYKILKLKSNKLVKYRCLSSGMFNDWNSLQLDMWKLSTTSNIWKKFTMMQNEEIP